MQIAIDLFRENIRRSRDLAAIFRTMNAQTTGAFDVSDVLRASLVTAVSTMDHYIHELVRLGMLEAYRGVRTRTPAFFRFQVALEKVLPTSSDFDPAAGLETQIRERHGHQSFQTPDSIADALRLVADVDLWNEVSKCIGIDRREITDRLTLITQRRNKIVHEADIMRDYAGQMASSDVRSPIDEDMVDDAIDFIDEVSETIYILVSPR